MDNIMIAIDFEDENSSVLTTGLKIAGKFNSRVWLVHVAAPEPDFVGYDVGPQYIRDDIAETLRAEHRWLQKYKQQFLAMDIDTEALLIQGPTVETLMEEMNKLNIDLLIIGNHKHGFLHEFFKGSTASELIKEAEINLLLVPLKES